MSYKRPAIFLDRDGTLIEEVNYLSRVEDLRVFSFTPEAIRNLKNAGFLLIVVTNQSGIGRGIYDEAAMHAIHASIQVELDNAIDAFYFCPHLPCDGCLCRKPDLGMIDAARAEFEIEMENSWMVGDKKVDVETGHAANLKSALVLTGYGPQHYPLLEREPTLVSDDLGTAAAAIIDSAAAKIIL
jgi:D-glycero-D-manno-heptose 1,7-bisphosphate phosphatase